MKIHYLAIITLVFSSIFFTGCKTTESALYDIRGEWDLIIGQEGEFFEIWGKITFAGSETSGTVIVDFTGGLRPDEAPTGTYTVSSTDVTVTYTFPLTGVTEILTGTVTTPSAMNGTWTNDGGGSGYWNAAKV